MFCYFLTSVIEKEEHSIIRTHVNSYVPFFLFAFVLTISIYFNNNFGLNTCLLSGGPAGVPDTAKGGGEGFNFFEIDKDSFPTDLLALDPNLEVGFTQSWATPPLR